MKTEVCKQRAGEHACRKRYRPNEALGFKRTVQNDEAQDASRRGASLMVVLQRVFYLAVAVSLSASHAGEVQQDFMAILY